MKLKFSQRYTVSSGRRETTTAPIAQNAWNHLAVVFDGSTAGNTPTIYVNGTLIPVVNYATPDGVIETSTAFNIGNNQNNGVRTFDGTVDEVHILNSSLSAQWIETMFNNPSDPADFFTP